MDEIQNDDLRKLDAMDAEGGVNTPIQHASEDVEKTDPVTSLGKARSYDKPPELSGVEDSHWKLLNLELLPSRGMFYPEDSELMIKSATGREIRHWSTIDEHDPIDVREKINFVLNKCTKFKVRGNPRMMNFSDYADVDKYHILFRIYELTFPNQENKLMAKIRCNNKKCRHVNKLQVTSRNLIGFDVPEELRQYYNPEEKCFIVYSPKLEETLRFYLPTSGTMDKFREKKKQEENAGVEIDKAFYNVGPYLVKDFRNLNKANMSMLKQNTFSWSDRKFTIIHKFTEMLRKSAVNKAAGICEKCKSQMESSIFLGGSFTVKDIFIVSARLDELI